MFIDNMVNLLYIKAYFLLSCSPYILETRRILNDAEVVAIPGKLFRTSEALTKMTQRLPTPV